MNKRAYQNSQPHAASERPNLNNPNDRAHFGGMGRGDISGWTRATTAAFRPPCNFKPQLRSEPVHDLAKCRTNYVLPVVPHDPAAVVRIAGPEKDDGVAAAIKSTEKAIEASRSRIAAGDVIIAALQSLAKKGGTVRDYA